MRVGAGVRPGVHVNQAQVFSGGGEPISNIATAQVESAVDPLLDETLVLGTVFDDRDGDGWQDSAALAGVQVQGGFSPGAYVPNSTTLARGNEAAQPVADASSPMLHGIAVGGIAGRQSIADPVEARQVVIRQRLRDLEDEAVLGDFKGKEGDIVAGVIQQSNDPHAIHVDLGTVEGLLGTSEQVPLEEYKHGDRIRCYVIHAKRGMKGPLIGLSRTHPNLVRKLFALEVPEIADVADVNPPHCAVDARRAQHVGESGADHRQIDDVADSQSHPQSFTRCKFRSNFTDRV